MAKSENANEKLARWLNSLDGINHGADFSAQEDKTIIVKQGEVIVLDKPASGYGENVITWANGEIQGDRVSYTNKR
ncbi:hypothetical protein Pryu01_03018 [Paraliobacillus ryukyuensis]|uniref:Uncharacterized protein DUF3954 n=1 Tax=Paraliobacillus ryukyuensis TaxID=200904 RepID=A0A366DPN2_9BACI|nr:DUF3954 domain-containing protein [Paraliobacillus ryukyuensis]RBO92050.1 uncharacterized protein DUF3954 [Paraliobacillus ryukyuensis]